MKSMRYWAAPFLVLAGIAAAYIAGRPVAAEEHSFSGWCHISVRCQNTDQIEILPFSRQELHSLLQPGRAMVQMGLSIRNAPASAPMLAGWIAVDPKTGQRRGKSMIIVSEDCPGALASSGVCSGLEYRSYVLEPGTYALGWVGAGSHVEPIRPFADFAEYRFGRNDRGAVDSYTFSDTATVRPNTPVFTVSADQIVYVGTLVIDMEAGTAVWTVDADFGAAKANLRDRFKKADEADVRALPDRLIANPGQAFGGP
jgi:hypothetical protein